MNVLVLGIGNMGYVTARDLVESTKVAEVVIADLFLDKAKQIADRIKSEKVSARAIIS